MALLSAIGLGLQGVSVIGNIIGGKKAADRAEDAAAEEARIEREITEERVRQIDVEEKALRGETIARTAASGVVTNRGSPLEILAEQAYEFEKERTITEEVGASKSRAALDRGSALASRYKQQGYQGALSGLTSIWSIMSENKRSTGSIWG